MSIYISVFLSSTVFLYAGEKIKDKKLNRFLIVIGLLIPSIIAACRADSVGTDVLVYGKAFYTQSVSSSSFITYVISKVDSMFSDFGFYFLTYILSRFFKDYHIGFFVYAILVQVFFYIAFKRCKKLFNTPVWFAMLLINLFLYNISLNLMRQCIAVPIAFFAWTYLADGKIKQYILFTIIAVVFHSSALITVLILPMYLLLRAGRNKQPVVKIMQGILFCSLVFVILYFGSSLIQLLVARGIIRQNYLSYLANGRYSTSSAIDIYTVLQYLIYIILGVFTFKCLKNRKVEPTFLIMCVGCILLSKFGTTFNTYVSRVGYNFYPYMALLLANIDNCFTKQSKKIYRIVILAVVGYFWYQAFVLRGYNATVPYYFFWN